MPACILKEINEYGIVSESGEQIPWEEIKIVGKYNVVSIYIAYSLGGRRWTEYYIKKSDGKRICLLSTDNSEVLKDEDVYMKTRNLFEEAQKHPHVSFEESGSLQGPKFLNVQEEIEFFKKMLSPEIRAQRAELSKNSKTVMMVILVFIFLLVCISGILSFIKRT